MPDEFDPTNDLGLPPDRYVITTCEGFLTGNPWLRQLCCRFIENGGHFYDVLDRYDRLIAYVLNREDATAGSLVKWCAPFLKAYGATDHLLHEAFLDDMKMLRNAERTMRHISGILPTFVSTALYEQGELVLEDNLKNRLPDIEFSRCCVDQTMFGRSESRKIRDIARDINRLKIPKTVYRLNVPTELDEYDLEIIRTMDDALRDRLPATAAMSLMESTDAMTSHRKAYRLLEVRKQIGIDLDNTMCIGSTSTDFQPLDLVRDAGGLAVSFNGEDFAVRGSSIAVMSDDTTVAAIFADVFGDKGPLTAIELANNWSRSYLRSADVNCRRLIDTMLAENPRKLPEVHVVDASNMDVLAEKSEKYRRKLMGL